MREPRRLVDEARIQKCCGDRQPEGHSTSAVLAPQSSVAELIPPERRTGAWYNGKYAVSFRGEIIVRASSDPECDLARVLFARGFVGKVKMVDATSGTHRSTVDIEKAAKLCTKEGPLRFAKQTRPDRPPRPEDALPDSTIANGADRTGDRP
jgi:hypothetical protein